MRHLAVIIQGVLAFWMLPMPSFATDQWATAIGIEKRVGKGEVVTAGEIEKLLGAPQEKNRMGGFEQWLYELPNGGALILSIQPKTTIVTGAGIVLSYEGLRR